MHGGHPCNGLLGEMWTCIHIIQINDIYQRIYDLFNKFPHQPSFVFMSSGTHWRHLCIMGHPGILAVTWWVIHDMPSCMMPSVHINKDHPIFDSTHDAHSHHAIPKIPKTIPRSQHVDHNPQDPNKSFHNPSMLTTVPKIPKTIPRSQHVDNNPQDPKSFHDPKHVNDNPQDPKSFHDPNMLTTIPKIQNHSTIPTC